MSAKSFFERYGVAIGVVLALVLALAILPGNASDRGVETGFGSGDFASDPNADPFAAGADGGTDGSAGDGGVVDGASGVTTPGGSGTGGTGGTGGAGGGAGGAVQPGAAGGSVQFGTGPNCRADGRQKGISFHMPPCVKWDGTDNGGATFRGVTEDKIVVVKYRAQLSPATEAILAGASLADNKDVVDRAMRALLRYSNLHFETYGREVVFVNVDASGPSTSEEAMRADALRIANDIKPFAVLEADPSAGIPWILSTELAKRGILCFCSTSRSSASYTELPPAIFSELPTIDEYAAHVAEYIGKKLEGKPAEYAGDDQTVGQTFRTSERRYGILYLDGSDGVVDGDLVRARDAFRRELGKWGIGSDRISEVSYNYQPGRNQTELTNIIVKFKSEGVTTVLPIWDPLTPILLTQEATRQAYYPEWFMIGTGLSDTTTAGRLYDQGQWQNAFGVSPLWVTWEKVVNSPGYRESHHAVPSLNDGDEGVLINVYRERIETMFMGIHMAGPVLTNESLVRGIFNYPPTGGVAGAPLQFFTREFPTEIKDFVEVWYDNTSSGPDEREQQGTGVVWKAQNGKRFQLGQWTRDPSLAFVKQNVLQVSDAPPGGGDDPHERDGHVHPESQRCLSCR